ncbi:MAG: TonB-dependent receptor [Bryobacteraceae bacterium]
MHTLLLILSLFADLKGTVVDPMGMPVPRAQVTCNGKAVPTDDTGTFTVTGVEACEVTAEKAGFARQTATLKAGQDNKIELVLASASEEVLVTATGAPVALEEAGVSASIVTASDLQVRNMSRVQDVLRDVPGLTIVQTGSGGGTTAVFMRGGDSDSTVVLMDGIPMNDPGGTLNNLIGMSSSALDRIEVVRGPESALYGAEAASGVIQMFTKHGDPEAKLPHGTLQYERGSFSTDHWTAELNGGAFRRFDYSLTADQYRTTGQFANNTFRNTTGTANIGYQIAENTSIRALFREFDSFAGTPGLTGLGAFNLDARSNDRDTMTGLRFDDVRSRFYSHRATFSYHRLSNISRDETRESYQVAALTRTEPGPIPTTYFVGLATPSTVADPGLNLVVRTVNTSPFGVSLRITDRMIGNYQGTVTHRGGTFVGKYDYERQSGNISGRDVFRNNNGVSLYEQYSWMGRIFASGGARVEHSDVYGWRFAPRGAVTFRLPTNTYLRFSLGRSIKQPGLLETFGVAATFVGNPNLKPATTDSLEIGLTREWFNRRVRTEAAYFRNRYTDLIQFLAGTPGTWQNVARSRSRGLEISGMVKVTSTLAARASYTKLNTRILGSATASDVGLAMVRRPENSGTISVEYAPKRWTAIFGTRFVGNSRDTTSSISVINRITPYNIGYMSLTWQANRHLAPYLSINNLFNEQYQQVIGFGAWDRNATGGVRVTW